MKSNKKTVFICHGTACVSSGSPKIREALDAEIERLELDNIEVKITGCHGFCQRGPIVIVEPEQVFYTEVKPEDAVEIVQSHLQNGEYVERLFYRDPFNNEPIPYYPQVAFYDKQQRIVILRNCGHIDPENIDDYLAVDGYEGLRKALLEMTPEEVIEEVTDSGLRGRGGAGFPTGVKWGFCRKSPGDKKYMICNADEGDPGAFMDRSILEADPHTLIEGLAIGAYSIGADEAYVYVRVEYPLAIHRLNIALKQAEERGFLGENILGSDFSLKINVMEGAGAFVCGEETALMESIEGNSGRPRPRPPYPAQSGLWGNPTNINNVKTLSSVPVILTKGAEWYSSIGTEKCKGTAVFALTGHISNSGLVEVAMGTTLREIVYDIGGGIPDGKAFKAVQTGGPSGGCLPVSFLDTPVDYETLAAAGSIMGSGGMVVMNEDSCMVDVARYFMSFIQSESCGKCTPCRLGTERMLQTLTRITQGKGQESDLDFLYDMAIMVKNASLCALGQTASNTVLSTLKYFREEYEAHVKYKQCPANVCDELISSACQHTCPIDTEASVYIALIVQGRMDEAWEIIRKDNPLPSICARVCDHKCESRCRSGKWGDPISIRSLKRYVTDYAMKAGTYDLEKVPVIDREAVAVVGSGPAGLMAGYFLANKGFDVTIFESEEVPGGVPALQIPEYRLPLEILNRDIDNIKKAGVKIKTNTKIGKDIPFSQLMDDFSSVFISTGAHRQRILDVPGEDAEGVINAMGFLKNSKLKRETKVGKKVGVIGGGNSAIDSARTAIRHDSCDEVTLLYRRTRAEMPAYEEEIEEAIEEGVIIQPLVSPKQVIVENGKVVGLECIRNVLGEMDEGGRRRPVPVEGSEFIVELDTLIVAIGESAEIDFLGDFEGIEFNSNGTVVTDSEVFATTVPGVFAGGDVRTNPNTVIDAMQAGKVAADMIEKYIGGDKVARDYELTRPSVYVPAVELTEEERANTTRVHMPTLPPAERANNFKEVELGLTDEQAVTEAKRCLRCELGTEDAKLILEKMQAEVSTSV